MSNSDFRFVAKHHLEKQFNVVGQDDTVIIVDSHREDFENDLEFCHHLLESITPDSFELSFVSQDETYLVANEFGVCVLQLKFRKVG